MVYLPLLDQYESPASGTPHRGKKSAREIDHHKPIYKKGGQI